MRASCALLGARLGIAGVLGIAGGKAVAGLGTACVVRYAIAAMQGRLEDYDPRRTDVWAAGVMLVVSLLGAFPFDHTHTHTPGTTDDELDLWSAPLRPPRTVLAWPTAPSALACKPSERVVVLQTS